MAKYKGPRAREHERLQTQCKRARECASPWTRVTAYGLRRETEIAERQALIGPRAAPRDPYGRPQIALALFLRRPRWSNGHRMSAQHAREIATKST
jgi:hypothetical protein